MNPLAAKLLMCVCAGGTGAAILPAVHHFRHASRPLVHHAVAAATVPCAVIPVAVVAALPDLPVAGGPDGLRQSVSIAGFDTQASGLRGGNYGRAGGAPLYVSDSSGVYAGGGGGPGVYPGGGGPPVGIPVTGGGIGSEVPPASELPDAASWAMMIAGFGVVGGSMRYSRRLAV